MVSVGVDQAVRLSTFKYLLTMQRISWKSVRQDMVSGLLGGSVPVGLGGDVCKSVKGFEFHPLTVENLREIVVKLKRSRVAWVMERVADFEYELPIPEGMPDLPGHFHETWLNRWRMMIDFGYHCKKRLFKVSIVKYQVNLPSRLAVYRRSRRELCMYRMDTSKEDFDKDEFLYHLRDALGMCMVKIKHHLPTCTKIVNQWQGSYKYMCGTPVKFKGAMCYHCRGMHLKRKYESL